MEKSSIIGNKTTISGRLKTNNKRKVGFPFKFMALVCISK